MNIPRIYPITDKQLAGKTSHLSILKELVRGGATLVQIRDKSTPLRDLLLDLNRCVEFAEKHKIRLIVNDRADLAKICGAAGVHLGQEDLPPEAARIILGRSKIIGFSTNTGRQFRKGCELPVDYLAFGPIFPTLTKEDASASVGLRRLKQVCQNSSKPVVAIGGITLDRVRQILSAGASSAAIISDLMKASDLASRMEQLLSVANQ